MVEMEVLSRLARSWLEATWLAANHSRIFSRRSAGRKSSDGFGSMSATTHEPLFRPFRLTGVRARAVASEADVDVLRPGGADTLVGRHLDLNPVVWAAERRAGDRAARVDVAELLADIGHHRRRVRGIGDHDARSDDVGEARADGGERALDV